MESTTASQPFVPLFEPMPSSRHSSSSSIWAPQPQPSDSAWSMAIDSFTRSNETFNGARPDMRRIASGHHANTAADVFGPLDFVDNIQKRDIGAIGDGRKKISPDFEEIHVEQLLRTLNLNSPAPHAQVSALAFGPPSPISPDLSPVSTTSALLTPTDLSPAKTFDPKFGQAYDMGPVYQNHPNSLLFETGPPHRLPEIIGSSQYRPTHSLSAFQANPNFVPFFEPFSERASPMPPHPAFANASPLTGHSLAESASSQSLAWTGPRSRSISEWTRQEERRPSIELNSPVLSAGEQTLRSFSMNQIQPQVLGHSQAHEPINFLSLLHPSSAPPYHVFVARIIKSSDQQASIFLQQKLKVADADERAKIVDAICARGFDMMAHRFGNWAVQRCLEATASVDERRKIVACMRGRVVELATNCYGCHVLQKALDCEEDVRLLIVSELLLGDPAQTLVNKHASHVWSKIMELSWTPPAPPIFAYVNKALKGKWASLACHETGSLVVQHAFENLEESAKDDIVDELLNQGPVIFGEIAKSQWGSYCIQHILEHGSNKHRGMALDHLVSGLHEYAINEQGAKSVTKALKEGGKETLDRVIKRMCEPAKGGRRATIVDLALSVTGSQLIASVLPSADKDQRALLYDSIRGHIVTLRGCKTGSKVIWLFDRMRAYYGY